MSTGTPIYYLYSSHLLLCHCCSLCPNQIAHNLYENLWNANQIDGISQWYYILQSSLSWAAVVVVQNKLNWPQKTLPFHPLEPANNNKQHRQKSVFYIINLSVECVYPKICPSISRTSERKKLRKFPENVVHTLWGMRVTIYLWNSLSTLYPFFSVRLGAYFPLCKTSTAQ